MTSRRRDQRRAPESWSRIARSAAPADSLPESGGGERNDDQHSEKSLGQTGVEDSDLIFQHRHAQTAENALKNDGAERGKAEIPEPTAASRRARSKPRE